MATLVSSSSLVNRDSTSPPQSLHARNFSTIHASSPAPALLTACPLHTCIAAGEVCLLYQASSHASRVGALGNQPQPSHRVAFPIVACISLQSWTAVPSELGAMAWCLLMPELLSDTKKSLPAEGAADNAAFAGDQHTAGAPSCCISSAHHLLNTLKLHRRAGCGPTGESVSA